MLQPRGDCSELKGMNRGLPGNQGMGIADRGNERCKNTEVREQGCSAYCKWSGATWAQGSKRWPGKVGRGHVPEQGSRERQSQ